MNLKQYNRLWRRLGLILRRLDAQGRQEKGRRVLSLWNSWVSRQLP